MFWNKSRPCPLLRAVRGLLLLLLAVSTVWADPVSTAYEAALGRHVTPAGVNYTAWRSSPADLEALRAFTDRVAVPGEASTDRAEEIAFLINAYNAWMLRIVLEHPPVASVKEIAPNFGVFSEDRITVRGRRMSLNTLEKDRLLKTYAEPRVHFAVNCASRSCPPLRPVLWHAATLEADLDRAAKDYLTANPLGFDEKSGKISQIFDWYAADFGGPEGVRRFLTKYRPAPAKPSFLVYDWSLNSIP